MEVEAARSSAGPTSMPSAQGTARAGGLGPHGLHKPESGGRNLGPQPVPAVADVTRTSVLLWEDAEGVTHRLRARSWHQSLIAQVRAGRPVTVSHEKTLCVVEPPEYVPVTLRLDEPPSCASCASGGLQAQRVPRWLSEARTEAA